MSKYLENLNEEVKEYFKILSPEFPEWLLEYIATPTFKHCIDFMNGDFEKQESTEERTEQIIKNSKKIMSLLNRDGIKIEEVSDYHIYPIADNDTPRLSADRFEYNFSSGMVLHRVWDLDKIKDIYNTFN